MKYSEFKRKVEEFGLTVRENEYYVEVESNSYHVLTVSKLRRFEFDNEYACFSGIGLETKESLYDLAVTLAKTPLVEREEEKLYNVIFPTIQRDGNFIYMAKDNSNGDPLGIDWSSSDYMKCTPSSFAFTEQEIKDIDERYLAFKVEVTPE